MIEIWTEFARFNTTRQRLTDQARIKETLVFWIWDTINIPTNKENYQQVHTTQTETLNTEKQEPPP